MGEKTLNSSCGCKLGRVAESWGVQSALADLEKTWRNQDASLRGIAGKFNQRVLRSALEASGHPPLNGEAANLYRLLSDEDVSGGMRTQARNRLRNYGVDLESVEADFVSYQTVNRHLKGCRELSKPDGSTGIGIGDAKNRLLALRNRTVAVTNQTIGQLVDAGTIEIGTFEVHVDIGVTCTDCGFQADIVGFLTEQNCRCSNT